METSPLTIQQQDIDRTVRRYQTEPNSFFREVLGREPWGKQQEINNALALYNKVAVRSCHASGKTWDAAGLVCWFLTCFPESTVLTTAPTFRQVEQLMWREIRTAHRKSKIPMGGTMLTTRWEIDDNWFAVGLSTDEPDNFSGFHAAHLLVIVDEASGVGDEIYEAIDGVMAGGNAKLLMIGNPTRLTGYFAKAFKDPDVQKMHISGFDTPNVAAGEVIVPGLMKPEYPGQMERKYGKNSDIYRIKVEGKFGKKETDTLISVDQVEAAIQREVKPEGKKRMAVDVARFGDDKSIILVRQGHKVRILEEIAYGDTMELAGKIKHWAKVEEIPAEEIDVDVVGVGGGVVDRLHEQGFDVNGVNVGSDPILPDDTTEKDLYLNLRAQAYWIVREEIDKLDLPNDDELYEIANIKYKINSRGLIQIESKDDMKKRGVQSPDKADALMLSYVPHQPKPGFYL